MLEAPGAGLAALQIGVSLRVFTYHVDGELGHLINPTCGSGRMSRFGPEGCLSFPSCASDTRRALTSLPAAEYARRARRRSSGPSCFPALSSTKPTALTASFIDRLTPATRLKPCALSEPPTGPRSAAGGEGLAAQHLGWG